MYFTVAPAIPLPPVKDMFTYQSETALEPGAIVRVSVGKRTVSGVVIGKVGRKPPYRTKEIGRIFPAVLSPEQLALGARIAGAHMGGLGYTLRLFYPPSLAKPFPDPGKIRKVRNFPTSHVVVGPLARRASMLHSLAQDALAAGKQVLIVVPERWMVRRFPWATAFHASMRATEAKPVWDSVASGKPVAVVGTQKAFFLPWRRLALLVLDEEQLPTHKIWDGYPRGDNRRLAEWAAQIYQASIVSSGQFPSLKGFQHVQEEKDKPKLYTVRQPIFDVTPFSFEDRQYRRLVPAAFVTLLRTWKREKKRVLILHNEKDGSVAKALRALRLLKKDQIIIGTSALFAKVQDETFNQVVWVFPEVALSAPDVRSGERGYVLLARLHGMLASSRGTVTIVTRQADFIHRVFAGTVPEVYGRLLSERKKFLYPPYSDMVRLLFRNKTGATAQERAKNARQAIRGKLVSERDVTRVLGPYSLRKGLRGSATAESSLLLLGNLDSLLSALPAAMPDIVDIDPQDIL